MLRFRYFRVLGAAPEIHEGAVASADADVVEVEMILAGIGAVEDDADSFAEGERGFGAEADDAVLPFACACFYRRAGGLGAAVLVDIAAFAEVGAAFGGIAFLMLVNGRIACFRRKAELFVSVSSYCSRFPR